jgi:hypothetical protein
MPEKLLRTTWTNLDSQELRLLLNKRIGGPSQFYNREANPNKFYLPLAARVSCRVVLTLKNKQIIAVEPGAAFDRKQWRTQRTSTSTNSKSSFQVSRALRSATG